VGALFDEHAPMVLAICRYLLRDPQAAEDAAQETFLAAHRSLLRGTDPRDPPAWLATIARNKCRRAWRTTRTASLDERTAAATTLDPAEIVADRADLTEVANAIGKLPPRQREALVLREFCGLSYEQVAAAMSVSRPVVDSLLSRARRGLTERVGYIPRAARGALVVPASLREELARLIPGLEPAGTATAAGVGGLATLTGLSSGPVAAKVAATSVAAVALALPVQATMRNDQPRADPVRRPAPAKRIAPRPTPPAPTRIARSVAPPPTTRPAPPPPPAAVPKARRSDDSGPGSHRGPEPAKRDSSGPGPGTEPTAPIASSGNSGPGSSGSGSSSHGSGSSGPESEPVGLTATVDNSGSGSSSSGSGSSGSGSTGSGSDSTSTGSSGSGSSGSGSSGSGSSGSGSGEPDPDDD
jgi:RNA polymerase sigma factor (sigma-70 family)